MALTIYHVWTCDICGHTIRSEPQHCEVGDPFIHLWIPPGWNWINGSLVCNRHELTIGKEKDPERKAT